MNNKFVITETIHYVYSLHPKWCCAHFCYLFTKPNSIQITNMADESQDCQFPQFLLFLSNFCLK